MAEPIGIGINGAGRIGALTCRATYQALQQYIDEGIIRVVAFNDVQKNATPEGVAQYLTRDSVHRKFPGTVEYNDTQIIVNGDKIDVLRERNPAELKWGERGARIVLEATGVFDTAGGEKSGYMDHLRAGTEYVVISYPVKDDKAKMVVLGVNYDPAILNEYKAISNASCTTNCLAPLVKILRSEFGIVGGDMITIHAYTNDQMLVDAYHSDPRRRRAAGVNIIPTSTGVAKAIDKIFPDLKGKIKNAKAYRVPVLDGSVVDFTVKLERDATPEQVNESLRRASETRLEDGGLEGVLEFIDAKDFVSSDVIGNPHSSVFDSQLTKTASEGRINLVSWYDNEWGYSNRTAELILSIAEHLRKQR